MAASHHSQCINYILTLVDFSSEVAGVFGGVTIDDVISTVFMFSRFLGLDRVGVKGKSNFLGDLMIFGGVNRNESAEK